MSAMATGSMDARAWQQLARLGALVVGAAAAGLLLVQHPTAAPTVSLVLLAAGIVALAPRRSGAARES